MSARRARRTASARGVPTSVAFEAVRIAPEGWRCLTPWIQTPEGSWWRAHIAGCERYGEESRQWAQHMAEQLNRAMAHLVAPPALGKDHR